MLNARIYLVLARHAWQEAFLVPQKLAAALFVLCLRLGLLFSIYRIAYTVSGREPQGVPLASAIWGIGTYFMLLSWMIPCRNQIHMKQGPLSKSVLVHIRTLCVFVSHFPLWLCVHYPKTHRGKERG